MNTNAAGGFPHVILASASPRRLDLLRQAGIEPEVEPSHVVEVIRSTKPDEVVMELSRQKAEDIAALHTGEDAIVIGADTVVAYDGKILGKPKDEADAIRMIRSFQGKVHQVYTGVTVLIKKNGKWEDISFSESTDVSFYPVSDEEIRTYIASGEPMDKAGSYGIQGGFGIYVKEIRGEYTNVVGLPVGRLFYEMKKHGIELRG